MISIVIPCYNSQNTIAHVVEEIENAIQLKEKQAHPIAIIK